MVESGMRSVFLLECHWRPALLWLLLVLLCYSRSEAVKETNSSSPTMTSTASIHPSTTTHPFPNSRLTSTLTPPTATPTTPPSTTTPPPIPRGPLLDYDYRTLLYLRIEDVSVTFTGAGAEKFPHVNRSLLDGLGSHKEDIYNSANEIVFTKWYGSDTQNFSLQFDFSTDTSGESTMWYIRSITHSNPNVSSDRDVLFVYQGVQYSVRAPLGYLYSCGKVRAVGYDLADPGVIPTLELRNITVQAFYKEKISEKTFLCGDEKETDNKQIGLIIGLVVGIAVILAIIVIAISAFIMKWRKKTDYDLLD